MKDENEAVDYILAIARLAKITPEELAKAVMEKQTNSEYALGVAYGLKKEHQEMNRKRAELLSITQKNEER